MIKRLALVAFTVAVAATTLAFEYLEWGRCARTTAR
jgi:hypothetical protein